MQEIVLTVHSAEKTEKIKVEYGTNLAQVLSENGYYVPAFCGGKGNCKKCSVRVISGEFSEKADESSMLPSCRAAVLSDCEIKVDFPHGDGLTFYKDADAVKKGICGIAVDIGTTTVAARAVYNDGSTAYASALNPQSAYGADVISRINACSEGKLDALCKLIRDCVSSLAHKLYRDTDFDECIISGNTVMQHIFCGISPTGMGAYPFTPAFTHTVRYAGSEICLPAKSVILLPCASAFIGSDVLAGIYALRLHKTHNKVMLADLGTNGELVLSDSGILYCTSAPAGPALEGGCMECGTGGVQGAISSVYDDEGTIKYTCIGNTAPKGICSPGIIDAVSLMLKKGLIDETGATKNDRFYICEDVYISQSDIRQLQLAKSAVYSGVEVICEQANIPLNSVDEFYLSGGIGYYTNTDNAVACGILPNTPCKIISAGNTSLAGAFMCICNRLALEDIEDIADKCKYIDLGGNPSFADKFMNNMYFQI